MRVKLRALLNSRGITQAELAQATGIRPSTISQLCNNIAVGFKFSHLELICRFLKCDLNDILSCKKYVSKILDNSKKVMSVSFC